AAVVRWVARTREPVIADDLRGDERFARDAAADAGPCSVLCVPLVKGQKLVGAIYLENGLAAGAFPPERLTVIELLSAQAALSIQNAVLYAELEQHSRSLERKVEDRTRDLQERNAELGSALKQLRD